MISRDEIEGKSKEFDITTANVERDYVFGWLLCGIYTSSNLKDLLILKGGNAFRKGYFETTRFSSDLDFSTERKVDPEYLKAELNKVCDFAQECSGVVFEKQKNLVQQKEHSDKDLSIYEARIYFKDFYGKPGSFTLKVKLDITEFDRIYLPVQNRFLIHPYSDANKCRGEIRCLKLEEMLASKLKCLLQRRHSFDLFDFVFAIFINKQLEVDRSELVNVFLRKTIFSRSPGMARKLLLGLPFPLFQEAWEKYIVCPKQSLFSFQNALEWFGSVIKELFQEDVMPFIERMFYPADYRNLILNAGSGMRLMEITYHGHKRVIEPYSLTYKRRKDGQAQEYFFAYDRSGGSSGPGIKTFLNTDVRDLKVLEEKFEPRYPVELSKAGEPSKAGYFSKGDFSRRRPRRASRDFSSPRIHVVQCIYCRRQFRKSTYDAKLGKHKDRFGNYCHGRQGILIR